MAKTSKTMLNESGKNGHPCFISDLRGNALSFSPLCDVSCGLVMCGLYFVEVGSLCSGRE